MRWTVQWDPAAEDELARIWLRAADRGAVSAAQARADQLLSRDPLTNGRHLSEGLYQIDVPPLAISYTVDQARQLVVVTWVRRR
jgi:hypothetical protein